MFYRRLRERKKIKGHGAQEDEFVMIDSMPIPIASQEQNEKKLVKIIEKKIESNSIVEKKKSKPKKIEYIDMSPLLR